MTVRPREIALSLTLAITLLPGCSSLFGGGSSALRIESRQAVVEPQPVTAVYRAIDPNTADIFISDFPPDLIADRLAQGDNGPPGTVTHFRLFIEPNAGDTPIDFGATSSSIRHIVFTGSSYGVYGGGGFLLPSDSIGDTSFTGRIRNGTLKLVGARPGFADRLGLAEISGRVSVTRDDALAETLSARITALNAAAAAR
jgi:hypothetical protein